MYDTVGYHSSTEQASFRRDATTKDDKYTHLLPETQLKENEYHVPGQNHGSSSRSTKKRQTTCIVIYAIGITVILILLIVGVVLLLYVWYTQSKSDEPQTDNSQWNTSQCRIQHQSCQTVQQHSVVSTQ